MFGRSVLRPLRVVGAAVFAGSVAVAFFAAPAPANAHGFSSVVYVDVSSPQAQTVEAKLSLEYDLTEVSVARYANDDPFFQEGQPAWDGGDFPGMVKAVEDHIGSLSTYLFARFTVSAYGGAPCAGVLQKTVTVAMRDGVPYTEVVADFTCPEMGRTEQGHVIASTLFPDAEQFVTGTKTIVTYDVDGKSGSATLDSNQTSFSTEQAGYERFWQFFRLGAEHLLTGPDHILFLIALIAGSRRLREVVLAATAFTAAHSVTFIIAALAIVHPPESVVEPLIALSIAAVAGWCLFRLWRKGSRADELITSGENHFALDRAGWGRIAVVFAFGLIHGLGFAGALGIQEAFSWQLLWSLLIFNAGIEVVQLSIIAIVFPLLAVLRHRAHRASLWVLGVVTAGVMVMGVIWFVGRLLGVPTLEGG